MPDWALTLLQQGGFASGMAIALVVAYKRDLACNQALRDNAVLVEAGQARTVAFVEFLTKIDGTMVRVGDAMRTMGDQMQRDREEELRRRAEERT